jgi:hypothetical protein
MYFDTVDEGIALIKESFPELTEGFRHVSNQGRTEYVDFGESGDAPGQGAFLVQFTLWLRDAPNAEVFGKWTISALFVQPYNASGKNVEVLVPEISSALMNLLLAEHMFPPASFEMIMNDLARGTVVSRVESRKSKVEGPDL